MAKRLIAFVIAFAIPLIALLSHHELRRILVWDALALALRSYPKSIELLLLLFKPPDPLYQSIQEIGFSIDRWHDYEKLYRKTGKVWIGVFGLRYAMYAVKLNRAELNRAKKGGSFSSPPKQLDIANAEQLLRFATELSERDRENAFPMLAKSCALFALRRDDEALAAFHKAAIRPNYNTYEAEWLRLIAPKSFTCEERFWTIFSLHFPHLGKIRLLSHMVMWHSMQAEKEGDFRRALMLAEDVIKVGAKIRDKGKCYIENLAGMTVQHIGFGERLKRKYEKKYEYALAEGYQFAKFARQHGCYELAEFALKEARISAQIYYLHDFWRWSSWRHGDIIPGFTTQEMHRLCSVRSVGCVLLVSMALLLALALLSFASLWRLPVATDRHSTIIAVFILSGFPIAMVIWGIFQALKGLPCGEEVFPGVWEFELAAYLFSPIIVFFLIGVCLLPPLWQLRKQTNWHFILSIIGIFAFLGTATIACISTSYGDVAVLFLSLPLLPLAFIGLVSTVVLLRGYLRNLQSSVKIFAVLSIAFAALMLLFIFVVFWTLIWFGLIQSESWSEIREFMILAMIFTIMSAAAFVLLFFPALFITWCIWSRFGHHEQRGIYQSALMRLRNTAVLLLLIHWWGYCIVGFFSLPLRAKLHHVIDDVFTHGELAMIQREVNLMLQRR